MATSTLIFSLNLTKNDKFAVKCLILQVWQRQIIVHFSCKVLSGQKTSKILKENQEIKYSMIDTKWNFKYLFLTCFKKSLKPVFLSVLFKNRIFFENQNTVLLLEIANVLIIWKDPKT